MALGFHYDNINGAHVDEHTRAAWEGFCKVSTLCPFLKYVGNPWPHWNDMSPLMSVVPKSSHLHRPLMAKSKHSQKQKTASTTNSTAGPSGTQDPLAGLLATATPSIGPSIGDHSMPLHTQAPLSGAPMYQMPVNDHSASMDQMDVDNYTSSSTSNQAGTIANTTSRDPNSIPPSTPSIFLTCPLNLPSTWHLQ